MSDFKQLLKTILEHQNIQESSMLSSAGDHENKNLSSSDDIKHAMDFAKHKSHDGLNATFYHKGKKLITYHPHPNGVHHTIYNHTYDGNDLKTQKYSYGQEHAVELINDHMADNDGIHNRKYKDLTVKFH